MVRMSWTQKETPFIVRSERGRTAQASGSLEPRSVATMERVPSPGRDASLGGKEKRRKPPLVEGGS
jgi:hypothetical protein